MHYPSQTDGQDCRQLTMMVDGQPLRDGAVAAYTIQAALDDLNDDERRQLSRIRHTVGPEIGVVDSHFDDTQLLLGQLGFRTRGIASEDLGETDLRLIAISCPHRHTRLDQVDVLRFLERGGMLLSSDRAIQLPGISTHLDRLSGRPLARARLSIADESDQPTNPPVWLDPGHMPLDPSTLSASGAFTLAENALTGEPLVVYVRAGNGGILHSVPHWLQEPHPGLLTSVERRPLRSVPRFLNVGNSYPGISLGGFLAQRSMVHLLILALANALDLTKAADHQQLEREK